MVIRRVDPLSCAKIAGVLYAFIGLLGGVFLSMISLFGLTFGQRGLHGGIFGLLAIIALPIVYGAIGFVTTFIAVWMYNVLAGFLGGVQIDVE